MAAITTDSRSLHYGAGQRRRVDVDVDYALDLGLTNLSAHRRAMFNALYIARQQTPNGWIHKATLARIVFGCELSCLSINTVWAAVRRLKYSLSGTGWTIERTHGGVYRLVWQEGQ